MLLLIGAGLFGDWRQWLPWPKLLHHSYTNFDRFRVYGTAPWCFLQDSKDENTLQCHYLSENHCRFANYFQVDAAISNLKPDERGICVPNPLNGRASAGRAPTVITVEPSAPQ